jgi:23S rRNA (adenine2503-C2)-methyltransferase
MDIYSFLPSELEEIIAGMGYEPYRARQLFSGLHRGGNPYKFGLPKKLVDELLQRYEFRPVEIIRSLKASDGTEKFLFKLSGGNLIEGVLMRYSYGNTLCVSTQVGCAMGCAFCASTIGGMVRHLTAGEIAAEVISVNALRREGEGRSVTNVVLMGSGEPLHNYDNTVKFLRIVSHELGINISLRNISLSTCGLADKIYRFSDENLPVTLSLSLHSPFDEVRRKIMPVAKRYTVAETVEALKYYFEKTGRRGIIEYAMIKGVNVSAKDAAELRRVLRGLNCHINLIMLNEVKESGLFPPGMAEALRFKRMLAAEGLSATIRKSKGAEIEGACGQLRRRYIEQN